MCQGIKKMRLRERIEVERWLGKERERKECGKR